MRVKENGGWIVLRLIQTIFAFSQIVLKRELRSEILFKGLITWILLIVNMVSINLAIH